MHSTLRDIDKTLDELHAETGEETTLYTGNLIVVTTAPQRDRVAEALSRLGATESARQILAVLEEREQVAVTAELLQQEGGYIERLEIHSTSSQLLGSILPLLKADVFTQVWWASFDAPEPALFEALSELADRVIADTLSLDLQPDARYLLADLSWARSAPWRELVAQVFDAPEALSHAGSIESVHIRYAAGRRGDVVAKLFAAWVACRLGWQNLSLTACICDDSEVRPHGELTRVTLYAQNATFDLCSTSQDKVEVRITLPESYRISCVHLPSLPLVDMLRYALKMPERGYLFEEALKLARRTS